MEEQKNWRHWKKRGERMSFNLLVMYGHCRVGKSMLLTHFSENKQGIYHLAQETSPKIALEQFSTTDLECFLPVRGSYI